MGKFVLTAELKLQAPGNINSVVNQINSRLKDIQINFKLQDAGKAVSGLNDVSKAADRASNSVDKMGYAFGVSLKRFAAFSIASRAIGLFSNRLAGAIDDAINFQDQMVRLSQITGETTKDLRYIADEIGGLATKFGVTSKAILSATDILAQAGLQAKDLTVAINALAKTELAPTFGKIEDTAEGAVAILAQFGEGVGALERQLGSINRVAAQFAVESEDLISVIRRTGGVFKASGGSLEELLAVFTSVRATTRESAESIATGLRTIFTRIQRPQTIQYLKQFGIELTDLNGKFVGPFDAVKKLSEALSQFGEGDIRFIAIAEELGGYRQIGKVIPLIRQFSLAEQARQVAVEGGASLDEDAAKSQESLRRQFIKTQESFLKLIRDIGDTTSFQTMIKVGLNLANAFIKVADSIKPIIPLIGALAAIKFAQGIGNFAAGVGAGFRQIVGPRTKNAGGKIHAFARGGLVPGSGNRDTVPAMLSPGEFVIRKSSVNKIGAGQLAAMNENRYVKGGPVLASTLQSAAVRKRVKSASSKEAREQPEKFKKGYYLTDTDTIIFEKKEYGLQATPTISAKNFEKKVAEKTQGKLADSPNAPVDVINSDRGNLEVRNRIQTTSDRILLDKFLRHRIENNQKLIKNRPKKDEDLKFPDVVNVVYNTSKLPRKRFEKLNFGGYIRKYNNGTTGKGVTEPTDEEIKLYESLGSASGIEKFLPSGVTKKSLLRSSSRFNYGIFKSTLAKAQAAKTSTEQQKAQVQAALPQYGAAILKKQIAYGNELTDTAGRKFGLTTLYMGADDSKNIQDAVVKDGAVKLINDAASYMLKGIGGTPVTGATTTPNLSGITGSIFEAALRKIDGLPDDGDPDTLNFDFPRGLGPNAAKIFGADAAKLVGLKTDAKFASTDDARESIRAKVKRDLNKTQGIQKKFFGGIIQKFAKGSRGKGVEPSNNSLLSLLQAHHMAKVPTSLIGSMVASKEKIRSNLENVESYYGVRNAKIIGSGAESVAFDIGKRVLKISPRGILAEWRQDMPAFDTPNIRGVARYFKIKQFGLLAAALQSKLDLDEKGRTKQATDEDLEKLREKISKQGYTWRDDTEFNSGYKRGKLRALDGTFRRADGSQEITNLPKGTYIKPEKATKFATGGPAPSDTVPALLTPGEFVINKDSAQRIGYGNLNKMNKRGVAGFAKGGSVGIQKFANGGTPTYTFNKDANPLNIDLTKKAIEELKIVFTQLRKAGLGLNQAFEGAVNYIKSTKSKTSGVISPEAQNIIDAEQKRIQQAAKNEKSSSSAPKYKFKEGLDMESALQIGKLKEAFQRLKAAGLNNTDALEQAEKTIGAATKQTKSYINAEKKRIEATNKNTKTTTTSPINPPVPPSGGGPGGGGPGGGSDGPSEKDANASFVKFAAFTGAINTVGTSLIEMGKNADGTSTAFSRIAEASLGIINQVSAVVFALQQFGVSLNIKGLKQFFGSGKGSLGDKLFGGMRQSLDKKNITGRTQEIQDKLQARISTSKENVAKIKQKIKATDTNDPNLQNLIQQRKKQEAIIRSSQGKLSNLPKIGTSGKIASQMAFGMSGLLGAAQAAAGPLAAVAASAYVVTKAFNGTISALYNYKEQIETAVKAGDREKAGQLAEKQYGVDAGNSLRTAGIAGGAVIGAAIGAIGGPVGIAIGGAIGAIAGGILATIAANLSPQLAEFVNVLFGGDTMATAKAKVQLDASLNYYTEQQATNLKAVDAATQAWQSGLMTTGQALETMGANARNAAIAMQDAVTIINELEKGKAGGENDYVGQALDVASYFSIPGLIGKSLGYSGRDISSVFTLGYVESDKTRNESVRKQQIEQQNKAVPGLISEFNALTNASNPLIKSIVDTSGTYDEVMAKIKNSSNGAASALAAFDDQIVLAEKLGNKSLVDKLKGEKEAAKTSIEAAIRASANQRKYLETLNLGLFNVVSGAQAAASALELIAMQGEGVDPLTKSMKVLEAAVTSQAGAMDPKQIETATQEYANSLRQSGLAESDVQKNVSALQATTQVQAGLGTSLDAARSKLQKSAAGGNPEEIRNALAEAATANITDEQQRATISARLKNINLDDQKIIDQLLGGDVSGILKAASEQLTEATKEQIEAGNLLAKNNQALSAMVMKRIEAEKQAADAANEAVDVGLEMAKVREQFGGPKVTIAQQRQASAQRTANILRGTGISGGAGTPQDLSRAGQQIQQELLALERKKAAGAFTDVDKQRETQLLQASAGVTDQKKKELELAKESAEVTKRKVSMEKSAFEKLLGGDVMGAIEDMMASSAAAALRSGDAGLAGAFGGKALLGGLKNLEEAGASAEQKQTAARAAGASFGIGPRLADAFAGTTREEMAANQQVAAATYAIEQGAKESADLAQARTDTAMAFEEQARAAVKRPPGTPISFGGTVPLSAPEKTAAGAPVVAPGVLGGATAGGAGSTSQRTGGATGTATGAPTIGAGISPEVIASFGTSVSNFVAAVDKLQNLKLSVQIDATNVNVNLNGGTFLNTLSTEVRNTVLDAVAQEIPKYKVGPDGKLTKGGIVG